MRSTPSWSRAGSFPPPPAFAKAANAQPGIYEEAEKDPVAWWSAWARKLDWMKPFTQTLEWKEPFAKWFADGELNASVNCLDRHVKAGKGRADRVLLRRRTGRSLDDHVSAAARRCVPLRKCAAQARHQEGRSRRDLHGMIAAAAGRDAGMRAHRRGAFGDLRRFLAGCDRRSRQRLFVRRADHRRSVRGGAATRLPLKANCDAALAKGMPSLKHMIVAKRTGEPVEMQSGRDHWWDDVTTRSTGRRASPNE